MGCAVGYTPVMPPVRKRNYEPEPPVRVPPYSVEAESAILGAILLDAPRTSGYLSSRHVCPEWFWVPGNRLILHLVGDGAEGDGNQKFFG